LLFDLGQKLLQCRLVRGVAVHDFVGQWKTIRRDNQRETADGTIMAVKFLLDHAPAGGYYTPSMLIGARCVEELPGSTPIRVD
jgi:short subunit dehydrogenase-like uncharacterized protein